ncbi:hypothetical protein BLOT_002387 [Blomia tropicalis]|nr:hypothetical protein BLOT_002387 [Blomia tropicalis]
MSHTAFFKCFHLVFQQVRIVVSIDPDLSGKYLTTLNFGHFHDLRMMTMINLNMMIITGHSHHSVWCCHQCIVVQLGELESFNRRRSCNVPYFM